LALYFGYLLTPPSTRLSSAHNPNTQDNDNKHSQDHWFVKKESLESHLTSMGGVLKFGMYQALGREVSVHIEKL